MFFGKSERKKTPVGMILIVGALAIIGAATVAEKGKAAISCACNKIKSLAAKKENECC